eukprot:scaffold33609_cov126-Skeletonema_dohrnii-CCMP3373.AAC.5
MQDAARITERQLILISIAMGINDKTKTAQLHFLCKKRGEERFSTTARPSFPFRPFRRIKNASLKTLLVIVVIDSIDLKTIPKLHRNGQPLLLHIIITI